MDNYNNINQNDSIGKSIGKNFRKKSKLNNEIKRLMSLTKFNFNYIVKSWMFYVIISLGILSVFFAIIQVTNGQKITISPVTNVVLSIPAFFFTSIITLLTFMYTGMLVNRDKAININLMVDSTPISNSILLFSKFFAILKMQVVLLFVMMAVGIGIQVYNGYFNFEIGQYLFSLFFIQFIGLIIWAITSLFVHVLVRNTFFGIFTLILIWLIGSALTQIGIDTKLVLFNFFEPLAFSDMYGYGNPLKGFVFVKLYWVSFSILLLILSIILVVRGQSKSIKERIISANPRFSKVLKTITIVTILALFLTGFIIYNNENKNDSLSSNERNTAFETFEKKFSKYSKIDNQPKVISMNLKIDLFTKMNTFKIKGTYKIKNTSNIAIDTLLIKTGFDEKTEFVLEKKYRIIDSDKYVNFYVLKLEKSLEPNDSLNLSFESKSKDPSVFDSNLEVVKNGSYIKNDLLPRFGYFLNKENRLPSDSLAAEYNYFSRDSDLLNIETTISTDKGQKAFAVGRLLKTWTEGDRLYFKYKTDKSIKNSLSFISGDYKELKETHGGIDFKVNAIENHHKNSSTMLSALKASYDYNTKNFTPYQHKDACIVEFPKTFGTHATVTGNLIPTSEIRFIASAPEGKVDLSFYAIAHEFTHYWWGNQVMPADALGAVMLTESITEYLTLNIYRDTYGEEKAKDFLRLQRDRYLKGRNRDNDKESTLELVNSEKQYIAYAKGAMIFNNLRNYMGDKVLNDFLKTFLLENHSDKGIYPTSYQFINQLIEIIPQDIKYMVEDGFRDVVLYDFNLSKANISVGDDDKYIVSLDIQAEKLSYKGEKEEKIVLNDYVQIGFYNSKEEIIDIKTIKVNSEQFSTKFILDSEPSEIVIDPEILLIEKDITNNSYSI